MEKIEIKKKYKFLNREYYYLLKDNKIMGKAWITTKTIFLRRGLYMKIIPQMRHKGYGTKFFDLLIGELSENEVEVVFMWVNKNNKVAINFINKNIGKYEDRFKFLNYEGFSYTIIVY